jgi:Rps23 Pro-64 3,4-dihydroxylase Tpa1-like proline 4-hydroxylase
MFSPEDIEKLIAPSNSTSPCVVIKDNIFDSVVNQVLEDVETLRSQLRPAKMSNGADKDWADEFHRGDSLVWVTPDLMRELGLPGLVEFIDKTILECDVFKSQLCLTGEYHMQFAMYPGKGEGYNRHKDAFATQQTPNTSSRQLTCLLYLNRDWEPENGGRLRVFTKPGVEIEGAGEPFSFWGVNGYDIDPLFGRMVIFRSDLVDHAVLPCFKERLALTLWIKGMGLADVGSKPLADSVFIFSSTAQPVASSASSDDDADDSDDGQGQEPT